ncbi:MAG: C10 family peptidase [Bacteroidales bacterium]|nr:C10 family peptidase [Bacteroidales bacterium]
MKVKLFLLIVIVLFFGCSKVSTQEGAVISIYEEDYSVSEDEVKFYANLHSSGISTKSAEAYRVDPVLYRGDTLLYVVNYDKGWEILTADKRFPRTIAYSEDESFSVDDLNDATHAWLDRFCNYIVSTRGRFTDISSSWKIPDNVAQVKGGSDEHENEWLQLVYVTWEYELLDQVQRLVPTSWGQESPWNSCTPLLQNGCHSYTGCGAVAMAQMEYYWHSTYGVPSSTYSLGECTDNALLNGTPDFDTLTLTLTGDSEDNWDHMALHVHYSDNSYFAPVAALMGRIGRDIKTIYLPNGSWSSMDDICSSMNADSLFCHMERSFSVSQVLSKLHQGKPSIVRLEIPNTQSGHFVIVDGATIAREKTVYYYKWMPRGTYPPVEWEEPDWDNLVDYVVSEPQYGDIERYFLVNWGYDGAMNGGKYMFDESWDGWCQAQTIIMD